MQQSLSLDQIGDFVRIGREKKGWTQKDLSLRTGLPKSHISNIENNKYKHLSIHTIKRLSRKLGGEIYLVI